MRRRWNKIMALLLASAVLTANVGMVSAFAAGDEKTEQDAQKEESEEKTGSDEKKADKEDKEKASQTSAPTVDVKEGTYSTAQKITLKCATKDAVIYYTTDGKEPTEKSTRFDSSKPVEVKTTTTIKAIAVAKDTGKSKVASFTYKIEESAAKAETETPAETPTATPTADPTMIPEQAQTQSEQGEAQLMPASSEQQEEEKAGETPIPTPTETATPTPTETPGAVSAISSGSVVQEITEGESLADLSKTETMQVIAGGEEFEIISAEWKSASASEIDAAAKYQVTLGLKAKEGFCFDSKTTVTFNGVTGIAILHSPVTENDAERTYVFELTAPEKAPRIESSASISFVEGKDTVWLTYVAADSEQVELQYKFGEADDWHAYKSGEKIPLVESEVGKCIVYARALRDGIPSKEEVKEYIVNVSKPTASVKAGTYSETQKVELKTSTPKAVIYYTVDGTDPSVSGGKEYTGPITVDKTMTIKARAYLGTDFSGLVTFAYKIEKAPEVKKITKISVLDLDKPSRGAKPDRSATVSSDTHATVESVEWLKDNKGSDIEGVFKANTIYYAYVHLKVKDGYEFDTETFVNNSTTSNAKISNYSHDPGVKSASKSDVVVYVAWKTQAATTASSANNTITGLASSYNKGATVTFTMNGAGASNSAEEGNERYVPVKYKISSSEFAINDNKPTVAKSFRISTAGTYTLTATFQKQVYDAESGEWKNVDGEIDTKTATVKINSSTTSGTISRTTTTGKTASSTSSSSSSSTSSKSKNAKTGDETPVGAVVTVFGLAGVAIVALVARKRKS